MHALRGACMTQDREPSALPGEYARPEQRQPFPVLNRSSFFPTSAARETPCFPGGFLTYYPKLSFAFSAKRTHNRHAPCPPHSALRELLACAELP